MNYQQKKGLKIRRENNEYRVALSVAIWGYGRVGLSVVVEPARRELSGVVRKLSACAEEHEHRKLSRVLLHVARA